MKHLLGSNGRGHRIDRIALTECPAIYTSLLSYISNWTARCGDGAGKKNAGKSDVGAHPGLWTMLSHENSRLSAMVCNNMTL